MAFEEKISICFNIVEKVKYEKKIDRNDVPFKLNGSHNYNISYFTDCNRYSIFEFEFHARPLPRCTHSICITYCLCFGFSFRLRN